MRVVLDLGHQSSLFVYKEGKTNCRDGNPPACGTSVTVGVDRRGGSRGASCYARRHASYCMCSRQELMAHRGYMPSARVAMAEIDGAADTDSSGQRGVKRTALDPFLTTECVGD